MDLSRLVVALGALLCASACASTPSAAPSAPYTPPPTLRENVRIPFVDMGGVRTWRALPDGSLLIESRRDKFYRATFFGSCSDLPFTPSIGFISDVVGSLDRFSGVVVRDRVCRFSRLDEVADPRLGEAAAAAPTPAPAPVPTPAPAAP